MAALESEFVGPAKLLNDTYCDRVDHAARFSLFSQLPAELRLGIWNMCLQKNRIIGITIQQLERGRGNDDNADRPPFYSEINELGNVVSGKDYYFKRSPHHRPSPLLQVNAEARAAALQFHRIRLPCSPQAASAHSRRCIYINPEFDYLHVQLFKATVNNNNNNNHNDDHNRPPPPTPELFIDVLHDCKAYDPRGHGVLHLVIGDDNPSWTIALPMDPLLVSAPQALESFKSTLAHLKTLFLYRPTWSGRIMAEQLLPGHMRLNRSMPAASPSEGFLFIGHDPRPTTDRDLFLVTVGSDPRATLWVWQKMEKAFGIVRGTAHNDNDNDGVKTQTKTKMLDVRAMVTCLPWDSRINRGETCCTDAKEFFERQERIWQRLFWKTGAFHLAPNPDVPGDVENAVHAVGFWLVEMGTFGELPLDAGVPRANGLQYPWRMQTDVVLTNHRPELGLYALDP